MPAHAHLPHGDLYIEYSVVMPSSVSDSAREGELSLSMSVISGSLTIHGVIFSSIGGRIRQDPVE
jgi:hypothetical protein